MSRKGQTEIFGLVIIVILLAIGLLFAVVILTDTPTREVERVKESVQAANFLNTMTSTSAISCGKRDVRELLQNCALATAEWTGAAVCDNGATNTCELADQMIKQMLDATLKKWGKSYKFFMTGTDAVERIKAESGTCTGERESSTRPEKVRPGLDISLTLQICQ